MATVRRTSQQVTLLMLVLASITVLTLDYHGEANRAINHLRDGARTVLSPIQRAVASVLHPIGDAVSGAFHYGQLETQNGVLRAELGAAQRKLATGDAAIRTAERTLSLDGLPFADGVPAVQAEVISTPVSNFQSTIELDRGTSSGIGPGMPVVSAGGLIGTVSSASSSTATVVLVDDSSSAVGVRIGESATFVAHGQGYGEPLTLEYVGGPNHARVGQDVLTSGLSGAYPPGIPVGTVSSVHYTANGLNSSILVVPAVNLADVQIVSVELWTKPA